MRIVVTPRDILQARLALAEGHERWLVCPVAQALKRRGFQHVAVQSTVITWRHMGQFRRADMPIRVREFVHVFDGTHSGLAAPFAFEFEGTP